MLIALLEMPSEAIHKLSEELFDEIHGKTLRLQDLAKDSPEYNHLLWEIECCEDMYELYVKARSKKELIEIGVDFG